MQWISFNTLSSQASNLSADRGESDDDVDVGGFDVNKTTSLQMGSQGTRCPPKSALVLVSGKFTGPRHQEKPGLLMGELQLKYDSV